MFLNTTALDVTVDEPVTVGTITFSGSGALTVGGEATLTVTKMTNVYSQQPVEVSRFHADLVYMFHQNQLKMITYDFGQEGTGSDFQYLQGALAAVYGEMREADAGEVVQLMDQIYPGYYSEPLLQQVCGWTAEDGTPIYLYYYADGAFAILYASAEIAQPGAGQYMINGL